VALVGATSAHSQQRVVSGVDVRGVAPWPAVAIDTSARTLAQTHDALPLRGGPPDTRVNSSLWSILASAALPGAGQAMLRQNRFVGYLGLEAYAWGRYVTDSRVGRAERDKYRSIARDVARFPFAPVRPDGDWDYYERMEKFVESGEFSTQPGPALVPEADLTTYNGTLWLQARRTYWANPDEPPPTTSTEYQNALAFYRDRAVRPEYKWSWYGRADEWAQYRRAVHRSNGAFRMSIQDLGIVIANHALSTVDGFVSVRLRRRADDAHRYDVTATIPFPGSRR
jgi:hypothetical protein